MRIPTLFDKYKIAQEKGLSDLCETILSRAERTDYDEFVKIKIWNGADKRDYCQHEVVKRYVFCACGFVGWRDCCMVDFMMYLFVENLTLEDCPALVVVNEAEISDACDSLITHFRNTKRFGSENWKYKLDSGNHWVVCDDTNRDTWFKLSDQSSNGVVCVFENY